MSNRRAYPFIIRKAFFTFPEAWQRPGRNFDSPYIKREKTTKKKRKPSKTGLFGVVFAMCGKEERPETAILGAFGEFQKNAKTEKRGHFSTLYIKRGESGRKMPTG